MKYFNLTPGVEYFIFGLLKYYYNILYKVFIIF